MLYDVDYLRQLQVRQGGKEGPSRRDKLPTGEARRCAKDLNLSFGGAVFRLIRLGVPYGAARYEDCQLMIKSDGRRDRGHPLLRDVLLRGDLDGIAHRSNKT